MKKKNCKTCKYMKKTPNGGLGVCKLFINGTVGAMDCSPPWYRLYKPEDNKTCKNIQ